VIDGRGVERRRAQQVHRHEGPALRARRTEHLDVDVGRDGRHADVLDGVLAGAGVRIAAFGPDCFEGGWSGGVPQERALLEVVEQLGIERVVVVDQHRALEQRAAFDVDGVREADDDLLVTLELGVVEGLDREEQLARAAVG
jgi:hypothetical protein